MCRVVKAALVEVHQRLGELNQTSLGGITLAEAMHVQEVLLGNFETSLHLLLILISQVTDVSDGNTANTSKELLSIVLSWLISKVSAGRKHHGLVELIKHWVLVIVAWNNVLVRLRLGLVPLMDLPVHTDVLSFTVDENVRSSHTVLGQSAGLIRTDARSGAERLDRLEVLDQDHLSRHSLRGKSQGHRDGGKQALRHVGDDDSNSEHHVLDDIVGGEAEAEENDTEDDCDSRNDMDETLNLDRQRCLGGLSARCKVGNLADDSAVTGLDSNTLATTSGAGCTEEAAVLGLHDEVLTWCLGVHEDIEWLAS